VILSKLTPAEVLLLRDGTKAPLRKLLKYTFVDLLLRQILKLHEVQEPHQPGEVGQRTLRYVQAGEKFAGYTTWLEHEYIFLKIFVRSPGIKVLFKNYIRVVKDNAPRYHKSVMNSPWLDPLIHVGFFGWLFNDFNYTPAGLAQRTQVIAEIKELETTLPEILKTDRDKALEILKALKGNVYLLAGIDLLLLHEIDAAFEQSTPVIYDTSPTDMSTGSDSHSSSDHGHGHGHSDGWGDSGCSSDNSGHSGCSSDGGSSGGDSGCSSGCSGCGGGGGGD
jgi:hypothetical protein